MGDEELRALERRWRISGAEADRVAWARELLRVGRIRDDQRELVTFLGQGPARLLDGPDALEELTFAGYWARRRDDLLWQTETDPEPERAARGLAEENFLRIWADGLVRYGGQDGAMRAALAGAARVAEATGSQTEVARPLRALRRWCEAPTWMRGVVARHELRAVGDRLTLSLRSGLEECARATLGLPFELARSLRLLSEALATPAPADPAWAGDCSLLREELIRAFSVELISAAVRHPEALGEETIDERAVQEVLDQLAAGRISPSQARVAALLGDRSCRAALGDPPEPEDLAAWLRAICQEAPRRALLAVMEVVFPATEPEAGDAREVLIRERNRRLLTEIATTAVPLSTVAERCGRRLFDAQVDPEEGDAGIAAVVIRSLWSDGYRRRWATWDVHQALVRSLWGWVRDGEA